MDGCRLNKTERRKKKFFVSLVRAIGEGEGFSTQKSQGIDNFVKKSKLCIFVHTLHDFQYAFLHEPKLVILIFKPFYFYGPFFVSRCGRCVWEVD